VVRKISKEQGQERKLTMDLQEGADRSLTTGIPKSAGVKHKGGYTL
jgi:hypothetical protein